MIYKEKVSNLIYYQDLFLSVFKNIIVKILWGAEVSKRRNNWTVMFLNQKAISLIQRYEILEKLVTYIRQSYWFYSFCPYTVARLQGDQGRLSVKIRMMAFMLIVYSLCHFFCWLAAWGWPYIGSSWQLNHFIVIILYQQQHI